MQYIPKGFEPQAWKDQRTTTPNPAYADLHTTELRQALAREQGYLCAFCMDALDLDKRRPNGEPATIIAHLTARNWKKGGAAETQRRRVASVDYRNMVLVCLGGRDNALLPPHCDHRQSNYDVIIPLTTSRQEMARMTFSSAGVLSHPVPDYDTQLNNDVTGDPKLDEQYKEHQTDAEKRGIRLGFLNLNSVALRSRRRTRWTALGKLLNDAHRWNLNALTGQLALYQHKDAHGRYPADCLYMAQRLEQAIRELPARTAQTVQPRKRR